MALSTTLLVAAAKRYLVPAVISTSVALGGLAVINHTGVHAASAATAWDPQSIAPLVSLDQAMEALSAHVEPSVVNIAVTSMPSAENTSAEHNEEFQQQDGEQQQGDEQQQGGQEQGGQDQGQQQGIPPGLQQFFGPGGPFSGFGGGGGRQMQQQPQQLEHGIGSGVIISSNGYILTNNHVVDGARDIKVTLHDRRVLNGHVVGVDKLTDLAVVKVDATNLPAIAWGDSSKLEPGQTVLAFGSPFGYFQFSVTRGIVSAVNRQNPYSDNARAPGGYIQTDAAINPGNSGGPLVDAEGQLVGIDTFIISNSGSFAGAGFAIPSQLAHVISTDLIEHGKVDHGYVGIAMNDVTPANAHFFNLRDASGAIVAQVTPDSPAAQAGLQQGDVITSLNGQKLTNSSALQVAVTEMNPGNTITLGITRNGQPMTLHVTIGEYNAKKMEVADNGANSGPQSGKLGLAVGDLTQNTRQQLNIPDSLQGAVIENVRPASPADDAGLQPGDIVLQVDRKPVTSADQFVNQVHANANQDLLLLVWSKGSTTYRTLRPNDAGQNG
jgi:serine protease Do